MFSNTIVKKKIEEEGRIVGVDAGKIESKAKSDAD